MLIRYVGEKYTFSLSGGCEKHFRVISGQLEGIYGYDGPWIAYYLAGSLSTISRMDSNSITAGKGRLDSWI